MKHFNRVTILLFIVALATSLVGPNASAQTPTSGSVVAAATAHTQVALGTNIPYQGQLKDNGTAANGVYDFQFKLYDDASAGSQVGSDMNQEDVTVANGLFSVALDFGGGVFNGEARYLEIGVRPGASTSAYTTLAPRRSLLASPYAQYSNATRGLSVDGNGNVGIGTATPARPLEVASSAAGLTNHLISFLTTADGGKGSLFGIDTINRKMYWRLNDSGDYDWQFQNAQGVPVFTVGNNGELYAYRDIEVDPNHAIGVSGVNDSSFSYGGRTMGANAVGWFQHTTSGRKEMWLSGRDGMYFFTGVPSMTSPAPRMGIAADGTVGVYGNFGVDGTTTTKVLRITGGDLAEPFEVTGAATIQPGMVVAIDPDNPGQMRLANTAYDHTVAGVISGAGGINAGVLMYKDGATLDSHPVALSGRVYVYADAGNGAIAPGDLLTTSATPGHAMKVTDHERAQGAILGKAMSKLAKGTGLVLVLVTLQ
ncbi:MAG: hypothetical protein U0350_14545 [Caldilineaceae bacterium]